MDRQAQSIVLENIRSQIANRWQQMVAELRSYGDQDLGTFLDESGIELSDILRRGSHSWTRLRRDAGLDTRAGSALEERLLKRIRAFAHVDDRVRADAYGHSARRRRTRLRRTVAARAASGADALLLAVAGRRRPRVVRRGPGRAPSRTAPATSSPPSSTCPSTRPGTMHSALEGRLADVPLNVHARYQREEVLAALDYASCTEAQLASAKASLRRRSSTSTPSS